MNRKCDKRKVLKVLSWGATLLTVVLWLPAIGLLGVWLMGVFNLVKYTRESASIGIIGGADGPTAIFVTSSVGFPGLVYWIACGVALVVTLLVWGVRYKMNKADKKSN